VYPQTIPKVVDKKLSGKCPHCQFAFSTEKKEVYFGKDVDGNWAFCGALCPTCDRFILYLEKGELESLKGSGGSDLPIFRTTQSRMIRPEFVLPEPIPQDIPDDIAKDYREASQVLGLSPNASAALSRRCLQNIIRQRSAQDIRDFEKGNLADEIDKVLDSKTILNENLNKMLHSVRKVGNFAAHPNKSKSTGLIMDVEPYEAEFNLKVIGRLLFWYYTELPAERKIIDEIDQKQKEKS